MILSHPSMQHNSGISRTTVLALAAILNSTAVSQTKTESSSEQQSDRREALILGSLIGDAAGGPVEFVSHPDIAERGQPFRVWNPGERLEPADLDKYGEELALLPYTIFRPAPEPYAHWSADAPAGTLTDDTRQKAITIDLFADAINADRTPDRKSTRLNSSH